MWKIWSNLQRYGRPVLRWFKPGVPLMLLVLLVLALGAIWWLGPQWTWGENQPLGSLTARILATVVLLVVPLLAWALRLRQRTHQLEGERKHDVAVQVDACLRYVEAQERDLDRSLALLQSNLKGRNALYQMPWYLVLGQENSGKTSFVNRSNQSFSLTGEVKAGSRRLQEDPDKIYTIDWWIGDQAVLIDPPGEIISQPRIAADTSVGGVQDAAAVDKTVSPRRLPAGLPEDLHSRLWDSFVAWLGRNRSRRPLNGVVLMVSLVSLLNQKPSDRKALAALLRARLTELSRELGTRPPLYVVLSKFDLLEGFETLFARLPKSAREDIFGFTFTLDSVRDYDAWLEELGVRYDAFLDRLNEQVFDAMADVTETLQRESLYSLGRQLSGLRPVLLGFLADVMGSDRFATPALPRGVFFSSVYQQGVLNNAFVASAAQTYDLREPVNDVHPSGRAMVYFAQQLFQRIIYPESGLAGDNPRVLAQKKHALALRFGIASLGSALIIGGWYHYYTVNRDKALSVLERSRDFSASAIDGKLDPTGRNLLRPLNQISNAVAVYGDYREAWPLLADLGLYQGRAIGPKVDEAYLTLLSQRFLPALASGVMEDLDGADTDSDAQLAALRVYRMIEDRPNRRPPVVEGWMAAQWQEAFPGENGVQRALMRHLEYAMKYADTRLPQYQARVLVVQRHLRQIPLPERVYMTMRREAGTSLRSPLDLRNEIGPAFDIVYQSETDVPRGEEGSRMHDNGRIDALLTAKGYRNYFAPHSEDLTELAMIDQWALGERNKIDYSEADKAALAERIRAIYSRDYVDTWQRNLNQLEVRDFHDIAQAVGILGSVTSPAAPLRRLVETVRDNSELGVKAPPAKTSTESVADRTVVLVDNAVKAGGDPQMSPPIMDIARAFAPMSQLLDAKGERASYLDETMLAISNVQDKVRIVHDSPDRGKAALGVVLERFSLKGPDPIANLQRIAAGLPEPMNRQVGKLADESSRVILVEALRELERRWDTDVYRFYRERLANRYPFNPASRDEASLEDFRAFFGPQGRLQQFRDKYLNIFLEENLEALYSERLGGYLVRADVLTQLESADRIRDAFFNSRGLLGVQFYVEPLGLAPNKRSSSLSVEGQLVTYNHGPTTSTALIWPNTLAPSNESRMTLVNAGGSSSGLVYRGPWSLYRLLSQARLNGATATSVDISFSAPDGGMRYRISTEKANNPFTQPLFKGFVLPQSLLQDGLRARADSDFDGQSGGRQRRAG
ncbi:type VI secretion system membrane subunit TssM [Pseudomonas aeruginosa]|uniref:type VI secretion system membrane subunit TssM n=1 Tax=Pseudomonas aeruginosa TaxID=287 RepID=UPI000F536618|nr:type VI secretion system membrane subunit TssM [Pseudomonas aeruginosa]RPM88004.1 type VI secretion system membrane subunit TssM [Pseudomonas aeruginosa]RPS08918.1 type VI secretion system membrane subunit TssM [Pseudomonas aeruginosa]HCE7029514.1 type VI secretion system membrane subunit TssM [Pseudomonas aeruginosa]